ncbi:hypothetical protein D3C87_1127900 [compost metagenome]
MRRLSDEATAPATTSHVEVLALDEEFFQRVDRVMLERKQADPFRRDAVWRATEEEVRVKRPQLQRKDLAWNEPR